MTAAITVDISELARALQGGGEVEVATRADAVDGVPVQAVARPANVAGVSAVLAHCNARGLSVIPRGGGTAMDWAAPPRRADVVVDLGSLNEVIEHAAGDLVVSAQAGTPLRSLREVLAAAGQELVIDAPAQRYDAGSTLGGALATAVSGPRRLQRLAVRDLVLGATVVLADGTVASSGGKVVKNVAGYDLAKLMTGSYGTLGIVVQAAFRLHPLAPARRFVVATGPPEQMAGAALEVLSSQLAPAAVEIDRAPGEQRATLAVLLEGEGQAVQERAVQASRLTGGQMDEQPSWWASLPQGPVLAKATATLTGVAELLRAVRAAEQRHGVEVALRGSALGVLHVSLTGGGPGAVAGAVDDLRAVAPHPGEGTVTVLRAPAQVRAVLDVWGPVGGLELMRAIKNQLDPSGTLAPGRFVGGI